MNRINIATDIQINITPNPEPFGREMVVVGKDNGKPIIRYKDVLLKELKKPLYEKFGR